MTTSVRIHCDHEIPYGVCAVKFFPARTIDEAIQLAEADGWYVKHTRDLCPAHAGTRR